MMALARVPGYPRRYLHMRGETERRWRELCEQAVEEQDPEKIMKLIGEVNQLLENNEERLPRKPAA